MTHYKLLDRVPSVSITSNRNELKVYQGNNVYLNNGDNFELRFFNPLQEKIGVEIIFNGVKKGDSLLVLNPGQDVILDRFLDEQRKMLFETYHIDSSNKQAVEAAANNGKISFNFYKEIYSYSNQEKAVDIKYDFPPKKKKEKKQSYKIPKQYRSVSGSNGINGPSGTGGITGNVFTRGISHDQDYWFPSNSTTNVTLDSLEGNFTFTSSVDTSSVFYSQSMPTTTSLNKDIETGRVEMGDLSNQDLRLVNSKFQQKPFHTLSFKLLPHSAKNNTISEVRQYCTECGYRIRKESWKYCPKCGERL